MIQLELLLLSRLHYIVLEAPTPPKELTNSLEFESLL